MSVIEPLRPRGSTSGGAAHVGACPGSGSVPAGRIGAGMPWTYRSSGRGWLMPWPGAASGAMSRCSRYVVPALSWCEGWGNSPMEAGGCRSGAASDAGGWWRSTAAPSRPRSSCTWVRPATVIPGWYGRSSLPFLPTWRRAVTRSPDTAQTCWRTPHDTGRRRSCVCGAGEKSSAAAVHGDGVTVCPQAPLVCGECTFTAGRWAREWEGMSTGECVVSAPCSVLVALARHYEIPVGGRE